LTHIDTQGEASMVEVTGKPVVFRDAAASRRLRAGSERTHHRRSHSVGFAIRMLLVLLLAMPFAGCVTKKQSDARVRAAYRAGRRDAMARMQQQQQIQSMAEPDPEPASGSETVSISGPVRNPVLPWRSNLTIREALIDSGYSGESEPMDIVLVRGGLAFRVAPDDLSEPMLPGDTLRLH